MIREIREAIYGALTLLCIFGLLTAAAVANLQQPGRNSQLETRGGVRAEHCYVCRGHTCVEVNC